MRALRQVSSKVLPSFAHIEINPEYGSLLIGFCRRGVIYVVGKLIGMAVTA